MNINVYIYMIICVSREKRCSAEAIRFQKSIWYVETLFQLA